MADEKIELTAEMEQFVSYIEGLTVLDLSKLVKALEERLGVSAAAPVAVAAAAPAAAAAPVEEKTEFDVVLVDGAPKPIKTGVPKEEADQIKAKLEAAGAKVEVK